MDWNWNIIVLLIVTNTFMNHTSAKTDGICSEWKFGLWPSTVQKCCEGYREDPFQKKCYPVCQNRCTKNKKCGAPNKCDCKSGYKVVKLKDYFDYKNDECEPICSENCISGTCTAPETCTCNEGFELNVNKSYLCEPICTKGCINGTCTAPEICTCFNGYHLNGIKVCEPTCMEECVHGICIKPNICECLDGYVQDTKNPNKCIPNCKNECVNGACTAPNNTCTCNEGYTLNNSKCEPNCKHECIDGFCSAPEICTCYPGYNLSTNYSYLCEPNVTKLEFIDGTKPMQNHTLTIWIVLIVLSATTIIGIILYKSFNHQKKHKILCNNDIKISCRFTKFDTVNATVNDKVNYHDYP